MVTQSENTNQTNLSLGTPDETWAKYEILQYPILFNGEQTSAKAIVKGKNLVSIAGKGYALLPNEETLKLANEAAELAGFVPFYEKIQDAQENVFAKLTGHVLCNEKETQMHAFYVPQNLDVTVEKNDDTYVGVDVVNSIDGKKSFGVNIFSFRRACKNGVLFGKETMANVNYMHTKSLNEVLGRLKTLFVEQIDRANLLLERYRQLAAEKATQNLIDALAKTRIPSKILPPYISDQEQRANFGKTDKTKWEVYNDVTRAIWHNDKATLVTKEFQFKQLHKVIAPLQVKRR